MSVNPYTPPANASIHAENERGNSSKVASNERLRSLLALSCFGLVCHALLLVFWNIMDWVPWIVPHRGEQSLACLIGLAFHAWFIFDSTKIKSRPANFLNRMGGIAYLVAGIAMFWATLAYTSSVIESDETHPSYIKHREIIESRGQ